MRNTNLNGALFRRLAELANCTSILTLGGTVLAISFISYYVVEAGNRRSWLDVRRHDNKQRCDGICSVARLYSGAEPRAVVRVPHDNIKRYAESAMNASNGFRVNTAAGPGRASSGRPPLGHPSLPGHPSARCPPTTDRRSASSPTLVRSEFRHKALYSQHRWLGRLLARDARMWYILPPAGRLYTRNLSHLQRTVVHGRRDGVSTAVFTAKGDDDDCHRPDSTQTAGRYSRNLPRVWPVGLNYPCFTFIFRIQEVDIAYRLQEVCNNVLLIHSHRLGNRW